MKLLPDERVWLSAVVADLADDMTKLAYADWLEERGDDRAHFLRAFVAAARSLRAADFPPPAGRDEEWLDLIGYRILERVAAHRLPHLSDRLLRLARPALRMKTAPAEDHEVGVGGSKAGGLPDLPPGFEWPSGGDCRATYVGDTAGVRQPAGFLAQVNFAEVAHTQAARGLPGEGLLSLFCYQDVDSPERIGAAAAYFPDPAVVRRAPPPAGLTEGNRVMPPRRLRFEETLDLPDPDGPWAADLCPEGGPGGEPVLRHFHQLNFHNVLGYGRSTTGRDPTPSKGSRHLIVLENAVGCQLHIQIRQDDLTAHHFDRITLNWVDFD